MELKDHVISKENQELLNGTRVSVDPYTAAPLQVATTIKPHGNLQSYSTVEGSLESTKESSPKGNNNHL